MKIEMNSHGVYHVLSDSNASARNMLRERFACHSLRTWTSYRRDRVIVNARVYDLTVRMSIFVGRIASTVTYAVPKRMVCEARAKRA